jgi:hypothetical protein
MGQRPERATASRLVRDGCDGGVGTLQQRPDRCGARRTGWGGGGVSDNRVCMKTGKNAGSTAAIFAVPAIACS